jgi:hypothetical protein
MIKDFEVKANSYFDVYTDRNIYALEDINHYSFTKYRDGHFVFFKFDNKLKHLTLYKNNNLLNLIV